MGPMLFYSSTPGLSLNFLEGIEKHPQHGASMRAPSGKVFQERGKLAQEGRDFSAQPAGGGIRPRPWSMVL